MLRKFRKLIEWKSAYKVNSFSTHRKPAKKDIKKTIEFVIALKIIYKSNKWGEKSLQENLKNTKKINKWKILEDGKTCPQVPWISRIKIF